MPEARFEVEEMLDTVPVRLAAAEAVRARGERRRMRRRLGAVAVAVVAVGAIGGGAWAALPGGPDKAQVAARPNPYVSAGVVTPLAASALPMDGTLHWTEDADPPTDVSNTLPAVGIGTACGPWVNVVKADGFTQYTRTYSGKSGAKARHRIVEYDNARAAAVNIAGVEDSLARCGLKRQHKGESSVTYAGMAKYGPMLTVAVEQYGAWLSVVEVQYEPGSGS
jgi:hypothetical protein